MHFTISAHLTSRFQTSKRKAHLTQKLFGFCCDRRAGSNSHRRYLLKIITQRSVRYSDYLQQILTDVDHSFWSFFSKPWIFRVLCTARSVVQSRSKRTRSASNLCPPHSVRARNTHWWDFHPFATGACPAHDGRSEYRRKILGRGGDH